MNPAATGYITVTLAYWAFMLTDGALRMLVLLHFHALGFSPLMLSWLFLVYELMGVVTNLAAGWLGARRGIFVLLYSGIVLQLIALFLLTTLQTDWPVVYSVLFVMLVQGLSGVAKDLTKTGAKSAVKLLDADEQNNRLFRLVAFLTGSKNAVKGLGFFLGAALLAMLGFSQALLALSALLLVVLCAVWLAPKPELGAVNAKVPVREIFSTNTSVNTLSAARTFLFAARDTWFVVALPVFLYTALHTELQVSPATAFFIVGSFLALWTIGYGFVQVQAPVWLKRARESVGGSQLAVQYWTAAVTLVMLLLALLGWFSSPSGEMPQSSVMVFVLIAGLLVFGGVFAICSSLHSYLILAFTSQSRATMDVGFYYMANAVGRLLGTLLSGFSYQIGGLGLSLTLAALMAGLSYLFTRRL
ncbi:MAG: organoarsenical effux MFS transporter ArsJ [Granulosicoccus sp.]|nr:organoarsenical effux MFS transporter ArsJ [Granulosicoccus sp.]